MGLSFLYMLGPLGASRWDNNELRYSLRSLESSQTVDWVGVSGPELPDWLTGVHHTKVEIEPGKKFANVLKQYRAAFSDPDVPENLILMNDDFLIRKMPWDWTPTYTSELKTYLETKRKNSWRRSLQETYQWLLTQGIENPLTYEGHTPMPLKKSLALPVVDRILESGQTLQFRSAYGNLNGIGGKLHPNAKRCCPDKWPPESPFWSLQGFPSSAAKRYIKEWLPKPSRFEQKTK